MQQGRKLLDAERVRAKPEKGNGRAEHGRAQEVEQPEVVDVQDPDDADNQLGVGGRVRNNFRHRNQQIGLGSVGKFERFSRQLFTKEYSEQVVEVSSNANDQYQQRFNVESFKCFMLAVIYFTFAVLNVILFLCRFLDQIKPSIRKFMIDYSFGIISQFTQKSI